MPKTPKIPAPSASPANRYVCVHGHFYQPPRENPWLETVESQDSAAPYHDWNDRITAECYAPNGASRIQNLENEIVRIVNNYSRMSFNFGPTLLSWLHDKSPRAYQTILDADKASALRYSGHGSAVAQVYNHIIMPLARVPVPGVRHREPRLSQPPCPQRRDPRRDADDRAQYLVLPDADGRPPRGDRGWRAAAMSS